MRTMWLLACAAWLSGGFACGGPAAAAEAVPCQVRVILFVPADVTPPAAYQPRIDDIVRSSEAFFTRELKRWGHEQVVMPFRRSADGHVEVTLLRGKLEKAKYKTIPLRTEVNEILREQGKLDSGWQVWWILVYFGEPPAKFHAPLGGFGDLMGGWGICNFSTAAGELDPEADLVSEFPETIGLKRMLYELGSGLRLRPAGPLRLDSGENTLMGPSHYTYGRVVGKPERTTLCEAEAALLASHPAFRGKADPPRKAVKTEARELTCTVDRGAKAIVVRGAAVSAVPARYAFVGDESDARREDHWTKTYVGRVAADGRFEVVVSQPAEAGGKLRVWFVLEDGTQTGDGIFHGREYGIAKPYTYSGGEWQFP